MSDRVTWIRKEMAHFFPEKMGKPLVILFPGWDVPFVCYGMLLRIDIYIYIFIYIYIYLYIYIIYIYIYSNICIYNFDK